MPGKAGSPDGFSNLTKIFLIKEVGRLRELTFCILVSKFIQAVGVFEAQRKLAKVFPISENRSSPVFPFN